MLHAAHSCIVLRFLQKHKHDNEGVTPTKKHKKKHHAGDES